MAHIDKETEVVSALIGKVEPGVEGVEVVSLSTAQETRLNEPPAETPSVDEIASNSELVHNTGVVADETNASRPAVVPPGSTILPSLTVPHPKRFSAVNINKKFLEKNSSPSGSIPASSTTTTAKSGGSICKWRDSDYMLLDPVFL